MKFLNPHDADDHINREFANILPKVAQNITFSPIIDGMNVAYNDEIDEWIIALYEYHEDKNILFGGVKLKQDMLGFKKDTLIIHKQYLKIAILAAHKNGKLTWRLREK
jgi:hypothetical protein